MGVRTSAFGWTELYIIFDIDPSVLEPLLARAVGALQRFESEIILICSQADLINPLDR